MLYNLSRHIAVYKALGAVAGGDTVQNGTTVDLQAAQGFGVVFNVNFGAITINGGSPVIKVQESDDNSSWFDLIDAVTGSALLRVITAGHANKLALFEVAYPKKRYLRVVVDRAASSTNSIAIISAESIVHGLRTKGASAPTGDAQSVDVTLVK